jgi:Transposase Tn5 dimerisation domain
MVLPPSRERDSARSLRGPNFFTASGFQAVGTAQLSLFNLAAAFQGAMIDSCLAIDLVVGWRIFHLAKLGREIPDVPCTVYFEEAEWKALVAYATHNPVPPVQPPTLREAIRLVASLGGFLGRKGDGEPGTQTLWLGLQRLDDIAAMWKLLTPRFTRLLCPAEDMGNDQRNEWRQL